MKHILIAADGSDAAREAVSVGLEIASEQGARATFVHVYPAPEAMAMTPGYTEFPVVPYPIETPPAEQDPVLAECAAKAKERGVEADLQLTTGDAVWEIVAAADEVDADLIAIGSRGLGTVTGTLLGSVSHAVIRHTRRPVLVVHPPKQ
jgi:nucleotide-binding universal stress UspA family protein